MVTFFFHNITFITQRCDYVYPNGFAINDLHASLSLSFSFVPSLLILLLLSHILHFFFSIPSLYFLFILISLILSFSLTLYISLSCFLPSICFYYYFCHLFVLSGFPYFPLVISFLSLHFDFFLSLFDMRPSWAQYKCKESQKLAPLKEATCVITLLSN